MDGTDLAALVDLAFDEYVDEFDLAALLQMAEDEQQREKKSTFKKNFNLQNYTDTQCEEFFRFRPDEITRLKELLGMPDIMKADNGSVCGGKT